MNEYPVHLGPPKSKQHQYRVEEVTPFMKPWGDLVPSGHSMKSGGAATWKHWWEKLSSFLLNWLNYTGRLSLLLSYTLEEDAKDDGQDYCSVGAGPVVQWLSLHVPLWQPGLHWCRSRVWTWHCLACHAVVGIPHIKERKMVTDVSSGQDLLNNKRRIGSSLLRANLPKKKNQKTLDIFFWLKYSRFESPEIENMHSVQVEE